MLKIYNSLTKQTEIFKPITPGLVNMYVCGMTVYDYCHIGHGRVLVMFDVITRYLKTLGYKVNYVRNITDIDDKIIKRANENKENFQSLTKRFIEAMHDDEKALGVLRPTKEPRATEYINEMVKFVEKLVEKGFAYIAEDGDVYYEVKKFHNYGALSHQDLEKLRSGIRVEVTDSKRDPLDFVLWKLAKPEEPYWSSPWGNGRPGWHLECSVMSMMCLGEHFDIHGGGFDLTFPHHENEIAQSEAATGTKFVNVWMHTGFLQLRKEKMSKSLGNILPIREVLKTYPGEVLRYFLLSGHYRSPINYSEEALKSAAQALERLYLTLRDVTLIESGLKSPFQEKFMEAMNDDFNTPEALAVLFDLAREINREKSNKEKAGQLGALLKQLAEPLGLLQEDPEKFLKGDSDTKFIEDQIQARNQARLDKNWAEADRIRKELLAKGIVLEDTDSGTVWRK